MMLMKMLMTLAMLMLMLMMMIMMSPHDQIYCHFRQMEHQLQLLLEQCAAQPPPPSEAQAELACPHCDQMLASDNTLRIHMGLHHVQARSMLSGDSPVVNCGKKFTKWQCPQHHIHGQQPHNKIGNRIGSIRAVSGLTETLTLWSQTLMRSTNMGPATPKANQTAGPAAQAASQPSVCRDGKRKGRREEGRGPTFYPAKRKASSTGAGRSKGKHEIKLVSDTTAKMENLHPLGRQNRCSAVVVCSFQGARVFPVSFARGFTISVRLTLLPTFMAPAQSRKNELVSDATADMENPQTAENECASDTTAEMQCPVGRAAGWNLVVLEISPALPPPSPPNLPRPDSLSRSQLSPTVFGLAILASSRSVQFPRYARVVRSDRWPAALRATKANKSTVHT